MRHIDAMLTCDFNFWALAQTHSHTRTHIYDICQWMEENNAQMSTPFHISRDRDVDYQILRIWDEWLRGKTENLYQNQNVRDWLPIWHLNAISVKPYSTSLAASCRWHSECQRMPTDLSCTVAHIQQRVFLLWATHIIINDSNIYCIEAKFSPKTESLKNPSKNVVLQKYTQNPQNRRRKALLR